MRISGFFLNVSSFSRLHFLTCILRSAEYFCGHRKSFAVSVLGGVHIELFSVISVFRTIDIQINHDIGK